MSTFSCSRCDGRGELCATCFRPAHRRGDWGRRCRGRRRIPCPGSPVKPKDGEVVRVGEPPKVIPHFETRTECDVCRVSKHGNLYDTSGSRSDSHGWEMIRKPDNEHLYLCPACHRRHEQIRTMTLEYLMNDRGGLCMGQWIDRRGQFLPVETGTGASTPQPPGETA